MHFQFKIKRKKQLGIYIPHSSVDLKCGVNRTPAVGGGPKYKSNFTLKIPIYKNGKESFVLKIPIYKKEKKSFLSKINEYMIKFNKKVKAFLDYIDDEQFY